MTLTRRASPPGADRGWSLRASRREGAAAGKVDASARVREVGAPRALTTPCERTCPSRRPPQPRLVLVC
jgi:hypothetical protein